MIFLVEFHYFFYTLRYDLDEVDCMILIFLLLNNMYIYFSYIIKL